VATLVNLIGLGEKAKSGDGDLRIKIIYINRDKNSGDAG
jgi:hypothetical protein